MGDREREWETERESGGKDKIVAFQWGGVGGKARVGVGEREREMGKLGLGAAVSEG